MTTENKTVKIAFLGDISFNDAYVDMHKNGGKPFEAISGVLNDTDFVVGNLECMAEGEQGVNIHKAPRLQTNTETLQYIKDINLGLACLAQNHIYDQLEDGYEKTVSALNNHYIPYTGAGKDEQEAERIYEKTIHGIRFCFLNYVTEDTNPGIPETAGIKLNIFKKEKAIADIKAKRDGSDFIILLLHWGGKKEGSYYPDYPQPGIARQLIDAGADLIIGSHSHTLQPIETYNGKKIFYSLGNFCFADIIFESKIIYQDRVKRGRSVIPIISFSENGEYICKLQGIKNKKLYIVPNQKILRIIRFHNFLFRIFLGLPFLWRINTLYFRKVYPVINYFFRSGLNNPKSFMTQLKKLYNKKFASATNA